MSHTTQIGQYIFSHNGDCGGSVLITEVNGDRVVTELVIPNDVLREFVANQVRAFQISKLEQISTDELLGSL